MSRARIAATVGIYGLLGSIAWAGTAAVGHSPWHLDRTIGGSRWLSLPLSALAGIAVGVAGVALSRVAGRRWAWGRTLLDELRLGVAGLAPRDALPLALASAIGEELCFRGGLQSGLVAVWNAPIGLVVTAALFGVVHVPWNRRLRAWTATAAVMGLVFGALYLVTGELLAPIAAHAVINHENMRFMLGDRRPALRMPARLGATLRLPRRA